MLILSIRAKQAVLAGETDAQRVQVADVGVTGKGTLRVLFPVPEIALNPGGHRHNGKII